MNCVGIFLLYILSVADLPFIRIKGYFYSRSGKYYVTICTADMEEWFGNVINGKMHLYEIGHIATKM